MTLLDLIVKITADDQASSKIGGIADGIKSGLGSAAKATGAAMVAVTGAAVAGAASIGKAALDGYADYEQLVGGVNKLFGESGDALVAHAREAYQTAGLSANEYMENVTSFSASLIGSLGGDTEAAVSYADTAMRDMADNANTFGTDIGSIQNAYQGFAKQNYTMLDNLKLGYGGTQEEMQRLIDDANRVKEANGEMADLSIDSFADVVEAIHTIQTEQGIMGTTANEAASTVSGSIGMLQGAWANFITDLGNGNADMSESIGQVVESLSAVVGNVMPVIQTIGENLAVAIPQLLPQVLEIVTGLVGQIAAMIPSVIPPLMEAVVSAANAIVQALPQILPSLISAVTELVTAAAQLLPTLIPMLIEASIQLFMALVQALPQILPPLIEAVTSAIDAVANNLPTLIPVILQAAVTLFMALVQALPKVLVSLLSAIGGLIVNVASTIAGAVGQMLSAAGEFFGGLVQGATDKAGELLNFVTGIPGNILGALGDLGGLLLNAGRNIIDGLLSGIKNAFEGVKNFVGGIGSWIAAHKGPENYDKNLLVNAGELIMNGLGRGLESGMDYVEEQVNDVNALLAGTGGDVSLSASGFGSGKYGGRAVIIKDCSFNVRDDSDIQRIGDEIARRAGWQTAGRL